MLTGGTHISEAEVTWAFASVDGFRVTLTPSGTIDHYQLLPPETGCTTSPAPPPIQPTDGTLVLDYTDPMHPTYRGGGITTWPGVLTCPMNNMASIQLTSGWFWADPAATYPHTPGQPIAGTRTVSDMTAAWNWALY